MFQDIVTAIPLGFVLAFMFGPVFFVLLETAAIKGFRAAVVFDLGVLIADILFLSIAYFSTSTLLQSIKDDPGLFIFGGGILSTYGVITFIKQRKSIPHIESKGLRKMKKGDWFGLFFKGFLLNFVNIGVLGFWLGIIIAFGPTLDMDPNRLFVFFATVLITYFVVDLLKIILAKKLNHKLTPTRIFKLKRTISILIALFGLLLIVRGVFPSEMQQVQHEVEEVIPSRS